MSFHRLFVFGDQTVAPNGAFHDLNRKAKSSLLLKDFLEKALKAIHSQALDLNSFDRARFASIRSFEDLAEKQALDGGDVVLSTLLLCVVQLGSVIVQAEHDPDLLGQASPRVILGLCTGLLPASASAAANDVLHFIELAVEIVHVAIRTAIFAHRRSFLIEASSQSWAVVLSGVTADVVSKSINQFHDENTIPLHKQVYISADSESTITIGGPPSVLKSFLDSPDLVCRRHSVPIFAAFHATHLGPVDSASIIGKSPILDSPISKNAQLVSTSSGKSYPVATLRQALQLAILDILHHPLHVKIVIDSAIEAANLDKVHLSVFGPTNLTTPLHQAIKNASIALLEESARTSEPPTPSEYEGSFAIVGMGGRFPGSENLEQFWDILEKGQDLYKKIPKDRFDIDIHCDPTAAARNSISSAFGCFLENPGFFDTRMFNMSPREAAQTDPTHRLLMMAAYEALEMAGYSSSSILQKDKIGTFFGITAEDWREYNISQDIDIYYITGGLRSFASGRLNYHFKWEGPSYVVDTACSSSAAAIELACASLRSKTCDTVLAGGGNTMTGPNVYSGLSKGGFVSPTGSSKTLDNGADGYCRGEGIGVLVIKRLEDAISNHDNIQGIIRSIATNHSANAASITQPHAPTQQNLCQEVLRSAGLESNDINYVEMHGTGTQAGDTTEVACVMATFGKTRRSDNPLYIGAVKSNIGHGEGAAGVTSIIKSLMMFRKNLIPPHAGIKTRINDQFPPLASSNIHVAQAPQPFDKSTCGERPRRILMNSFGATGGNTCMVLEEPPKRTPTSKDYRSHYVVALSAKTAGSLAGNKGRLLRHLTSNPQVRIQDIAYTTTARRMHHQYRSAYSGGNLLDLVEALSADILNPPPSSQPPISPIVFTFPGQGSIFAGMGKQLFDSCPTFKESILELDRTCIRLGFLSFLPIIIDISTVLSSLGTTQIHQALVAFEISLARLWQSWGVAPGLLIGHSLGEYSALCISEVLSVSDTLWLVGKRAAMIEKACTKQTHGMLLIPDYPENVTALLSGVSSCEIACLNGPNSVVVSGPLQQLHKLRLSSQREGTLLNIDYAFHSSQLNPILSEFENLAKSVRFSKPKIPIASTLLGTVLRDEGVFSAQYLRDQTRNKVVFVDALRASKAEGLATDKTLWLEIGPETMCLNMVRSTLAQPASHLLPSRKTQENCWKTISKAIAQLYEGGAQINWVEYHRSHESSLRLLDLPTYSWTLKNYWIQFKEHSAAPAIEEKLLEPAAPPFLSTCLHCVQSEDFSGNLTRVTFTSNLKNPELEALIQGHCVDGVALCPSSVYADMALTAGAYIYAKENPDKELPGMDLSSFTIFSPLTLQPSAPTQTVELEVTRTGSSGLIEISVRSSTGSAPQEHARCTLSFGDSAQWISRWSRQMYLLKDRISRLTDYSDSQPIHRLRGDMVYKIFSSVVEYSEGYKGIVDIHMDSQHNEAVAKVRFRETPDTCKFTSDPCWMDCIAQMPGFTLNGSVNTPSDAIYMSTGWDSLQISANISGNKDYLCYVRIDSQEAGIFVGDVYLIDGDTVVSWGTGLKFQELKRSILPRLLGSKKAQGRPSEARAPAAKIPEAAARVAETILPVPEVKRPGRSSGREELPRAPAKELPIEKEQPPAQPNNGIFAAVVAIIVEEVGCDISEIADTNTFESLGVDSLLTISISSKLKSQMNLELPASLLASSAAVGELRQYLQPDSKESAPITIKSSPSPAPIPAPVPTPSPSPSPPSPPHLHRNDPSDDSYYQHGSSGSSRSGEVAMSSSSSPSLSQTTVEAQSSDAFEVFMAALANETGLEPEEIDSDAVFADLGVDSLMSIAVVGAVKDQTGKQLPASIFTDCPTVGEMRKALCGTATPSSSSGTASPPKATRPATSNGAIQEPNLIPPRRRAPFPTHKYTSNAVLVQGDPSLKLPALFMVTDGPGSATSYLHFPQFEPRLPVYALESPFLHCPYDYDCRIEDICSIFVKAIRNIQPTGPYLVGGWSIGGVYTYETVRQLATAGDKIQGVIIIDGACPKPMYGLPAITTDVLAEIGIFMGIPTRGGGQRAMPPGQKQHILGCVRAVVEYDPPLLDPSQYPANVVLLWSRKGMFENLTPKLKEALDFLAEQQAGQPKTGINRDWLTGERTSFDPKGWDKLLGGDHMECIPIEGDHFTIMNRPGIKTITGPQIQKAITRFLSTLNTTPPAPRPSLLPVSSFQSSFQKIQYDYDRFAEEVGFADFWDKVYPDHRRLVLAYTLEAFAVLGCNIGKMNVGDPIPELDILPQHRNLLQKLFEILEDASLIKQNGQRRVRTTAPAETTKSFVLLRDLVREFPHHATIHRLIAVTGSRLADCLCGDVDPLKLIFGHNRDLLEDAYTSAPMFHIATKHLGNFLIEAYRNTREHIQILEIGAGLGGTTKHLIDVLYQLGISFTYTFTDVSQSLVTAAEKKFSHIPKNRMQFLVLDIENTPPERLHGQFHTIVSTNCIHATRNLVKSTTNIRTMLRPDGFLTLAELTKGMFWYELVFGLLEGWWLFDDGRKHALADEQVWNDKLRQAGYRQVLWTESKSGQPVVQRLITAFPAKREL